MSSVLTKSFNALQKLAPNHTQTKLRVLKKRKKEGRHTLEKYAALVLHLLREVQDMAQGTVYILPIMSALA